MRYGFRLNFQWALADRLLASYGDADAMTMRLADLFGQDWLWGRRLIAKVLGTFPERPQRQELLDFLAADEIADQAWTEHLEALCVATWQHGPQLDRAPVAAESWDLPRIATETDLADWLGLTPSELAWFADERGLNPRSPVERLRHYRAWLVPKGEDRHRLIEAPKERLRSMQRKVLDEILSRIPPHSAAHGFVRGRSVLSFAKPHQQAAILLRFDLRDFFPSIRRARVEAAFQSMGYQSAVARCLANLCTVSCPSELAKQAGDVFQQRRLPQGAPTSPALANYCTYRLDARLSGLAEAAGGTYSRYADDLALSGNRDFARQTAWVRREVSAIVRDEGFRLNGAKSRTLGRGQRQLAAGIVLNAGTHVPREDRKRLEAILNNCIRHGWARQNREQHPDFLAHLHGRICWVERACPAHGAKLRRIFEQIPR
jgi:retron-type reverse transcriptase